MNQNDKWRKTFLFIHINVALTHLIFSCISCARHTNTPSVIRNTIVIDILRDRNNITIGLSPSSSLKLSSSFVVNCIRNHYIFLRVLQSLRFRFNLPSTTNTPSVDRFDCGVLHRTKCFADTSELFERNFSQSPSTPWLGRITKR